MVSVSVNITTYNRCDLLDRCLQTVLSQSVQDIEVNIVDDSSTDGTSDLVSQWQTRDKRVRYYRNESNRGNAYSRNRALQNSSGVYVAFLDDDDYWIDCDKLKKQIELIEQNHNTGIVACSVRIYTSAEHYFDKVFGNHIDARKRILMGNSFIYNSTVLTKKAIMDEVGGFDENVPKGIDSDFFRNCILNFGYEVAFHPEVMVAVKEYGDDRMTPLKTVTALQKQINSNLYCLEKYKVHFDNNRKIRFARKKALLKNQIRLILAKPEPKAVFDLMRFAWR